MPVEKRSKKIQGKLIKHPPPQQYSYRKSETTIHIKASTPYVSALKRIEKQLQAFQDKYDKKGNTIVNSKRVSYITVQGMGKTVQMVLSLGLHFKIDKKLKVDVLTKSIGVMDEFKLYKDKKQDEKEEKADESSDDEEDSTYRKRNVSCIELHIHIPRN